MQKAWKTRELDAVGARPTLLAGASLWMLWVGWPGLMLDARADIVPLLLTVCAAAALVWGTRRLTHPARELPTPMTRVASWFRLRPGELETGTLLLMVPIPLAIAVALRPEAINQQALDTPIVVPAALALAWYGAEVLRLAQVSGRAPVGTTSPLGAKPWLTPIPRWERARRRALVAAFLAGAVAIGIIAPTQGGYERLAAAWQGAALEGGLLTAVLGGSLGVACAGLFLSESLRPRRPAPAAPGRALRRALGFLLLAVLGLLAFWATS